MAVDHYENFPVASLLLPARLRPAVQAIYAFARGADDVADEGDASPLQRLARLHDYQLALEACARGETVKDSGLERVFSRLGVVIRQHQLPLQPFRDLLDAFIQDVGKPRYADFVELADYCRRSANPVGQLMLQLYQAAGPQQLAQSDAICTSLQLINFLQDVAIDWQKGRVYLPADEMSAFGVAEEDIAAARNTPHWQALMKFQLERARGLMQSGAPLACSLPGRIGWELRLVVLGGLRVLERIAAVDYDVFRHRPELGRRDAALLLWRAARFSRHAVGADG